IFDHEREEVFFNNWIFACLAEDVAENNDYASFTVAGLPVVVRNMKGKLVAFRNVCSHRHSLIHPEGCGNGMFRCPYHGWTYDAEGVPIGIPDNARSFGFDKEQKRELALEEFAVATCGLFVFVRLAAEGPSLREYLGPMAAHLEHVSEFQPVVYARFTQHWAANWKMGVEITMEGYHAPLVHPQSFSKHVGLDEMPDEGPASPQVMPGGPYDVDGSIGGIEYHGPHSLSEGPISPESTHHLHTIGDRLKMPHSPDMTGYQHYFIYPNFLVGVNEGVNTCVQLYNPLKPGETDARFWLLTGQPADKKIKGGIIWQTAMKGWQDWTAMNSTEDKAACEAAQLGVRYAPRRALLGKMEERPWHFQAALFKDVEKGRMAA
ncbi:MAG TPA: aromatic ring-hydroxylating dioxygenase subunit alpha, partial [Alphaproteobacteria bacterium]|nr:aromatic ring-hydroxylating dioxygenase subunit alpha [Alphaproteobacteria bacterium]